MTENLKITVESFALGEDQEQFGEIDTWAETLFPFVNVKYGE